LFYPPEKTNLIKNAFIFVAPFGRDSGQAIDLQWALGNVRTAILNSLATI